MVDKSCFDIEPIEQHNVVSQAEMLVVEFIHIGIVEVDGILMCRINRICHAIIADAVAITKHYLCISVTLWVIGHSERSSKIELVELEAITKGGIKREITVGRESVA